MSRRIKIIKVKRGSNIARSALKIAKKALSRSSGEFKVIDVSSVGFAIPDGGGTVFQLTNVAQGDTIITRNANKTVVKMIEMKLMLKINASASSSQIRVILLKDKQTNGAVFAATEVLESVANILGLLSPYEVNNKQRFHIISDKVYVLNRPGVGAVVDPARYVTLKRKLNMVMHYDGTNADITGPQTNSLALLLISNEPTNEPTADLFLRTSFIDN